MSSLPGRSGTFMSRLGALVMFGSALILAAPKPVRCPKRFPSSSMDSSLRPDCGRLGSGDAAEVDARDEDGGECVR
eukprot:3148250-Prymnesium_polylepis.1